MSEEKTGILDPIKNSHSLRILLIFFLVLLLQIPIEMIRGVLSERQNLSRNVTEDITSKWGKDQSIAGPYLVVPYQVEITEPTKEGEFITRLETRHAYFLPDALQVSGNVDCEVRYRGIYKVPIYQLNLKASGNFSEPDFRQWGIADDKVLWDRAHLSVRISDVHAITDSATLTWNTESIGFLPGVGDTNRHLSGIHTLLSAGQVRGNHEFSFNLSLNGSRGLYFAPLGKKTSVAIQSNWNAPSFQGNWLPSERTLNDDGFEASWEIPFLGRNYPQTWQNGQGLEEAIHSSLFGVNFITPIDHYRMIQRSLKYKMLLIALTFATLWLLEVLFKFRIHVIQYLLMGAGMCVFYLLELALTEHIGFNPAYLCASAAIVILISSYCMAILKGTQRAAVVCVVMALLYGYLYLLLMNQDYALLVGSTGLFLILAAVMYVTRKIDWSSSHFDKSES